MTTPHSPSRVAIALLLAGAISGCSSTQAFGAKLWPFDSKKSESVSSDDEGRISILTFEQKLEADPALAGLSPNIPAPVETANWPQPGGAANNAPGHLALSATPRLLWRESAGEGSSRRTWIASPPVIVDGKIFVFDGGQELRAFDAKSGKRLWEASVRPKGSKDKAAIGGGVAAMDGRVFVSSGFGGLVAFDAGNGREIWRSDTQAPFRAAPTASDGKVFCVTAESELIAMDSATGEVLWTHQAIAEPAGILSASSPAVNGDTVIAPFTSGEVVALLTANGRRLWIDALTRTGRLTPLASINDIAGRPVAADGVVYAVSHSGVVAAIDQRTGQRLWARGLASTQTPLVAGDALYVVTVDGALAALDRRTGGAFWVSQLQGYKNEEKKKDRIAWTGPIMVGGNLLLASSEGEVVLVSPTTGDTTRTIDVGAAIYVPPVSADGYVYLVSDDAKLIALR